MFAWPMCYNHTISKQNENNFSWVCKCVGGVDESCIKILDCSIGNCYHGWENGIWRGLLILVLCRVRMNYSKSRMCKQPFQIQQQVSQVRSTSFSSAIVLAHERAEVHIQAGSSIAFQNSVLLPNMLWVLCRFDCIYIWISQSKFLPWFFYKNL